MEDINLQEVPQKETPKAEPKSNQTSLAILEEKVDKILKHQKTVRHLAIVRAIISSIFFLVFIVFPIVGGFYLFRFVSENVDFSQISGQYREFYESLNQFKSASDNLGGISDKVGDLKNLIE
ncbi:hypothetical protein KAR91_58785 [Candidatus Pacearchaeota archaeon]|nr:hypothetical protein [Candidatus Pacearchaeota archaeon]